MIEFIIVNDNLLFQTKIISTIETIMAKEKLAYHIRVYDDYNLSAYQLMQKRTQMMRIYILDMETPSGKIENYVRKIRKKDVTSTIIGIGNKKDYLTASKYLFLTCLNFFDSKLEEQLSRSLLLVIKRELNHNILRFTERDIQYGIHTQEIQYLERYQRKKTIIQTGSCSYLVSLSLEELKHKLSEEFVYQNHNHIINLAQYQLKNRIHHTVIVDAERTKYSKRQPQKGKRYTEEQKEKAIFMYYNCATETEIQKEIGMHINTLRIWVAQNKKQKLEKMEQENQKMQSEIENLCSKNIELETENKILKKQKRKSEQDCERFRKAVHILSEPSEEK